MPKAGSTTIANILVGDYEGKRNFDRHDNRPLLVDTENYFRFTTVRDPYARAISGFNHLDLGNAISMDMAFSHFHLISMTTYLQNELKIPYAVPGSAKYSEYITGNPGPGTNIHIIRVEELDEGFSNLPFVNKSVKLKKENESKNNRLTYDTNRKLMEYVNGHYADDFTNFGYSIRRT
jgi:Sulfotransferase family